MLILLLVDYRLDTDRLFLKLSLCYYSGIFGWYLFAFVVVEMCGMAYKSRGVSRLHLAGVVNWPLTGFQNKTGRGHVDRGAGSAAKTRLEKINK